MSRQAWAYISAVLLAGTVLSGVALAGHSQIRAEWLDLAVLILLASVAQLLEAEAPGRQSYYPTMVFLFAGVLLLHPGSFVLLVALPHGLEWAKARLVRSPRLRDWYVQPFNVANHIISGFVAYLVLAVLKPDSATLVTLPSLLAAVTAAVAYLVSNHLLVGQVLVLARGLTWRESGIMDPENLLADFVMLCVGITVGILWQLNPWLIAPALLPLLLIYRALSVPRLKKEAQTDDKTGLWNARHFTKLFVRELDRAQRFNRPMALIMADLDLLRNINNKYGHLAGDKVLQGVAEIIREHTREFDICGRFGGEEFSIVLPETGLSHARSFAERLRRSLEKADFELQSTDTPMRATMSLGVACFPSDGTTAGGLMQQADQAMYQAKLMGRNRVICASEVPRFVKLGATTAEHRLAHGEPLIGAFPPAPEPEDSHTIDEAAPTSISVEREEQPARAAAATTEARPLLPLFVGGVISAGAIVAIAGSAAGPRPDLVAIGLFALLAALTEAFEVNVYGPNTVSVSVLLNFAAALIVGFPGVACVSAAIALVHWLRMRPALYRTGFNWATHVLAGSTPVLVVGMLATPVQAANLILVLVPAALAALAYYLIDTGLIAVAISLSQGRGVRVTWREQFQWLAEHYMVLCMMGLFMAVAYTVLGLLGTVVFTLPAFMLHYTQKQYVERTERSMQEVRRMNVELTAATEAIRQLNEELFLTLAQVIEARDPYVSGHSARVAEYAVRIAAELGLSPARVENVRQAALLHDIGKIGLSEEILGKAGRLTAEEREHVRTHAALGAQFLETCQGLRHLAPMVRHHHERWDGTGYPNGLRGEKNSLEARILALCDAVEAMASDRPYRWALRPDRIIAEIGNGAGKQFDPLLSETFIRLATEGADDLVSRSLGQVAPARADTATGIRRPAQAGQAYSTP